MHYIYCLNSDLSSLLDGTIIVRETSIPCSLISSSPYVQVSKAVSVPDGYSLVGIVGIQNPHYANWIVSGFFWSNYVYVRVRMIEYSGTLTGDIPVYYMLVKNKALILGG